jgi:1,4-alpha-glucan branching enzyme
MPKTKRDVLLKGVLFEFYAPGVESVQLAGCFNDWKPDRCSLKKESGGWWRLTLKLKPGRYEYRYWVDDAWENDQRPVICVPNPYGSWNCVVEVL